MKKLLHIIKKKAIQKKLILAFTLAGICGVLGNFSFAADGLHMYYWSTLVFLGMLIGWVFLIRIRIVDDSIRKLFYALSFFGALSFVFRCCRYGFFEDIAVIDEYMRYAYHISFTAMPLCTFAVALCVGKRAEKRPWRLIRLLFLMQVGLCAMILTNPLHELFFRDLDLQTGSYRYGPLYYLTVAWEVALGIGAFVIIVSRCRTLAAQKNWYVPAIYMGIGLALIGWYYICGGAPMIAGNKIYNIQEVYCFTCILPIESMIQIGIFPGNSGYESFFRQGNLRAVIRDRSGVPVYVSAGYHDAEAEEDLRIMEQEIPGGSILWKEDLSVIRRIRAEIQEVTEELEGENELIRQENEVRAERIRYETQNRLYDKIAGAVRKQATETWELLQDPPDEAEFGRRMTRCTILGAYIKRMGNLMVTADEHREVSSIELCSAIRETYEALELAGKVCDLQTSGEGMFSVELLVDAYELFETVVEASAEELYTIAVEIEAYGNPQTAWGFLMSVGVDTQRCPVDGEEQYPALKTSQAKVSCTQQDGIWYVELRAEGGENS